VTLFISFLLIYNFNMDWWWYGIATAIWLTHFGFGLRKRFASPVPEQSRARPRELPDAEDEKKSPSILRSVPDGPDRARE
jgi:hypothetical protein